MSHIICGSPAMPSPVGAALTPAAKLGRVDYSVPQDTPGTEDVMGEVVDQALVPGLVDELGEAGLGAGVEADTEGCLDRCRLRVAASVKFS